MHQGDTSTCSSYWDAEQTPDGHWTRARCFSAHKGPRWTKSQGSGSSALTEPRVDHRAARGSLRGAAGEGSPRWQHVTADVQGLLVPHTPPEVPAPQPPNAGSAEDKGQARAGQRADSRCSGGGSDSSRTPQRARGQDTGQRCVREKFGLELRGKFKEEPANQEGCFLLDTKADEKRSEQRQRFLFLDVTK